MNTKVTLRMAMERRIVRSACKELMEQGCAVSLYYGEGDWGIEKATDAIAVVKEMHACDEEWLHVFGADGKRLGVVALVYGNDGFDVIADLHVKVDAMLPRTNALIDQLMG